MNNLLEYQEEVFKYLEYINYPDLVIEFEPECVANSIAKAVILFHLTGESYRMCAIAIFSLTMNYQIIPLAKNSIKH